MYELYNPVVLCSCGMGYTKYNFCDMKRVVLDT